MSLQKITWLVKNQDQSQSTLEKILHNRGFSHMSQLDSTTQLHDPFLFSQMQKATSRIKQAIADQQRIIIFGDYDVDGITGAAILVTALQKLGAQVSYRLPHREKEGYGLSKNFIQEFKEKNVGLLITVDCGISCSQEIALAKQFNIDTIITDHHHIPENIPQAYAILHPLLEDDYPFKGLTGAGVAFKLATALGSSEDLLELAAMGTISDMGPLLGENRLIVQLGLQQLKQTKRPGLQALKNISKIDNSTITAETIGFQLGPRINAAGRIGDPYQALQLLLQSQPSRAQQLANTLENYNQDRRARTDLATQQALANIQDQHIIIQYNENWHPGILGLIAGKVSEKTGKPAFILTKKQDQLVGSARCPDYFNVTEALAHAQQHLINFGGHTQAAGFSLQPQNFDNFSQSLLSIPISSDQRPTLHIDCELPHQEITKQFLQQINQLRPFGIKNKKPLFLIKKITPLYVKQIGSTGAHLKFSLQINNQQLPVILFNLGHLADQIKNKKTIDLVAELQLNRFNGQETLQLRGVDLG